MRRRRRIRRGKTPLPGNIGGKFEDAVHTPGQVLFPYSGYSGDRCMPGDWLPRALHAGIAAEVKADLSADAKARSADWVI